MECNGVDYRTFTTLFLVLVLQAVLRLSAGECITSNTTSDSITVQWNGTGDAVNYTVSYSNSLESLSKITVATTVTLTGLKSGAKYSFNVSTGVANVSLHTCSANTVAPSLKGNCSFSNINITSLTLSWQTAVGSPVNYTVRYGTNNVASSTSNQTDIAGLRGGTRYTFSVTPYGPNVAGNSTTCTGITIGPSIRGNCQVSNVAITSVTLSWEAAVGSPVNFTIVYNNSRTVSVVSSLTNRTDIRGLDAGTNYTFSVTPYGLNNAGSSVTCRNVTLVPAISTNCTLKDRTADSMTLSWSPVVNCSGCVGYMYAYNGTYVRTNSTSLTVKNLSSDAMYTFSVIVSGRNANSTQVSCGNKTLPYLTTVCGMVDWSFNSASATWNENSSISYYTIRGFDDGTLINTTTATFNKTDLLPSTAYDFVLASYNSGGNVINYVNCTGITAPSFNSTDCYLYNWSNDSVAIIWENIVEAEFYFVDYSFNPRINTTSNSLDVSKKLQAGTFYKFLVTVYGSGGGEGSSVKCSGTTVPYLTQSCNLINWTSTTVNITWKLANGAAYYVVRSNDSVVANVTNSNSTVLDELEPATSYTFLLTVYGSSGETGNTVSCTGTTAPEGANGCLFYNMTTTSLMVSWEPVKGVSNYSVVFNNRTFWTNQTWFASSNNLAVGTEYNCSVTAFGSSTNLQGKTVTCTGSTLSYKCLLNNWTSSSVLLEWNNTSKQNFTLVYGNNSLSINASTNATFIDELEFGTAYTFTLQCLATGKMISRYFTCTGTTAPVIPDSCSLSNWLATSVQISFPCTKSALFYVVSHDSKSTNISSCSSTLDGLSSGTRYSISVFAVGNTGLSSNTVYCSGVTAPEINGILSYVIRRNNSVQLSWSPAISAVNYSVEYNNNGHLTTTDTACSIHGLISGTQYSFTVIAIGSTDLKSNPVSCDVYTYPSQPLSVDCHSEKNRINLTLVAAPGGVDYYEVTLDCTGLQTCLPKSTDKSLVHVFTDLNPFSNYNFSIVTVANGKRSETLHSSCVTLKDDSPEESHSQSHVGAIVGTIIPVVTVIVIIVIVAVIFCRKSQPKPNTRNAFMNRISRRLLELAVTIGDDPLHITSKPIAMTGFDDYVYEMKDTGKFSEEYMELSHVGLDQSTSIADAHKAKNRYINIKPYDLARVVLLPDEEESDYINASWMPGFQSAREYIATQGPKQGTLDDFWRMIWEYRCQAIVMLTKCIEKDKDKCSHYWPPDNEPVMYADIQVNLVGETVNDQWTTREFQMLLGSENRNVKHYHYTEWPDEGIPDKPRELVDFVKFFRADAASFKAGPVVVHCSAGVGRTGTFIAVDTLMRHVNNDKQQNVDIFGIVYRMRMNRPKMVQTEQQYVFIHDCVRCLIEDQLHGNSTQTNHVQADESIYANQDQLGPESLYANRSQFMSCHA